MSKADHLRSQRAIERMHSYRAAAWHEAGHCLMSHAFFVTPLRLQLARTGELLVPFPGGPEVMGECHMIQQLAVLEPGELYDLDFARAQASICGAGFTAECRYYDRCEIEIPIASVVEACNIEFDKAMIFILQAGLSYAQAYAEIDTISSFTKEWLEEHIEYLRALADALWIKRDLDTSAILAAIAHLPPIDISQRAAFRAVSRSSIAA